jgi:aspartyl-tRNA(Asn)/glutamyl-tRNA(Gln) amidotransferase subunit A
LVEVAVQPLERVGTLARIVGPARGDDPQAPPVEPLAPSRVHDLLEAGATLVDVAIPHADAAREAQRITMLSEAYAYHEPDMKARPELYGKYTRRSFQVGAFFTAADYVQAQRVRSVVTRETTRVLDQADVLLMPTSHMLAPELEGFNPDERLRHPDFSGIWNLTGQPAMSVCCGFSRSGLPIGLQIVGKAFDEPMVLRVADAYQRLTDWHTRRPPVVDEVHVA